MSTFNIPWKCLDLSIEPKNTTTEPPKQSKTFAQALTSLCDIPASQLQQPVVKGDRLAIEIPDAAYQAGLDACKHNLHGRILWPKGSSPLSVVALKEKLSIIWKGLSKWGIISLGRGFFEFIFSSLEDVKRVRSIPSWNINPGLLKLFAWSKDFNPKLQQNSFVQVWVRIYGLSQEYWHKNILFTIAGSLGTPICIDSVTAKPMHERTFGRFARVLVDIDISQPLRYKVLVERKGYAFFVELEYEHIPDFCSACKVIGHHVNNCKRSNNEVEMNKEIALKKKQPAETKKTYIQTKHGRPQQSKPNEPINVDNDIINVEDTNERITHLVLEEKEPENIILASPKTVDIVPQHLDDNFETVLSPKASLRAQDKHLEDELNDNFNVLINNPLVESDTSSQGSYVDATQQLPCPVAAPLHQQPWPVAGTQQQLPCPLAASPSQLPRPSAALQHQGPRQVAASPSHLPTAASQQQGPRQVAATPGLFPDRVIKDMAFLKQSWANMAEEDEATQKLLHDPGPNTDLTDEGFQVMMSKATKKAHKKGLHTSRDSYTTRSKGSSKPFK
jgi:hypothetical protein